ncbi:hypothetical protein BH09PLA1_BH09PLA1_06990 [soil metagenome]
MPTKKRATLVILCSVGFATLASSRAALSQDDQPTDDGFASIPLEDEAPVSRIRTPRPAPPATEPTTAPTTEPAELEPLPYLSGDWNGQRRLLIDRGITLEATATVEGTRNFTGGIRTGNTGQYLFNLYLTLDTEKLIDFKGGTFFVNFQNHGGESASGKTAGDWQWLSNIDARETTQVSELWYQQSAFDGVIKLKVGKIDAWSNFANCAYAVDFLGSGMGYPVSQTLLPTYPDPAVGAELIFTPVEQFSASVGVFDGSLQEGALTGRLGPANFWGDPSDLFLIAELGTTWKIESLSLPGGLFVGATYHTGTFEKFTRGTQHGAAGAYMTLQQRLWREDPSVD